MRRGDIVTVAAKGAYTAKPRPAVIIQSDRFDETGSVTLCLISRTELSTPLIRLDIEPSAQNGLAEPSWIMVDKIATVPRKDVRGTNGRVTDEDMVRLNRALTVFLGIAD